ncbi:hypothetical protein AN962_11510 [Bacillus sp. FJAT-21955]|nr:hypothetical protein BAIE_14590 [Bacillus altitudinis]KQL41186.1 hypothetical protein AN962_11510 [Bacillus sp. FJAT-21955]RAU00420.1 hypothetical protein DEJ56_17265 [Bacillus altitudinis]
MIVSPSLFIKVGFFCLVIFFEKIYQYIFRTHFYATIHVRKHRFIHEFIIGKQKKQTFHTFFDRIGSMNE